MKSGRLAAVLLAAVLLHAQKPPARPVQARSASTLAYTTKDGSPTVEITNVAYEVTGDSIPGAKSRLVLRTTTRSTEVVGDKGVESAVTLEAWPLGASLLGKPVYSVKVPAVGGQSVEGALWVADRALDPDVSWWSVYKLGTGEHLFDTYVELLKFTISREEWQRRYAGIEVPPDDTTDARLKDPKVVGVLAYASAEKVIREALITCDDTRRAALLRSYADTSRRLSHEGPAAGAGAIRLTFTVNYPSPPDPVTLLIPIAGDDLDLAHAQMPAGVRVAAFRR